MVTTIKVCLSVINKFIYLLLFMLNLNLISLQLVLLLVLNTDLLCSISASQLALWDP